MKKSRKSQHGGRRRGSGRKPGAINRASAKAIEAAAKTGLLPHELLLAMSRGEPTPGVKKPTRAEIVDARKAAAPYFAPRLSAVALKAKISENPWNELLELVDGKSRGLPSQSRDQNET